MKQHLRQHLPLDSRRLEVLVALIFAMIQARSVVLFQLVSHLQLPAQVKSRYKRLKRFVQFPLPDTCIAQVVLNLLSKGKIYLVLDRTNWKLGENDINILLLSALWKTFAFPLCWTVFDESGNSDQQDRFTLVSRLLPLLKDHSVSGLLADREFIGQEWFVFLRRHHIPPFIRLKADTRVDGIPIWCCSKKLQKGESRYWHRKMRVYGISCRVLAVRSLKGELLFLAYAGRHDQALQTYRLRWNAENLHSALKTRGFHLEESGLYFPERVSMLLGGLSLAFVWCCVCGEFQTSREPPAILKHGYAEKSVFRLGLDTLQDALFRPTFLTPGFLGQLLACFVP
ncbi:IS4 family transposase [Deinococcus cellulosilyticus NBRC 106333 = KACC 11606]|uniref:IS4 family transposase n=1 Tax=Deinococcus cellulosilyticus (strain DSM 18568 / NBRC 106333 / KACC 11606 / 5516J-15) TaxID=1223518 RepID=A0A511NBA7_DEIC1|nr:IS4 family transposase [Deinococcus cellulosilyticus NBRC 106333 = KACC 11606]